MLKKFLYKSYKSFSSISKWTKLHLNSNYYFLLTLFIISFILIFDIRKENKFPILALLISIFIFSLFSLLFIRFKFNLKREISLFAEVDKNLRYKIIIENKFKRKIVINYIELFESPLPSFEEFINLKSPNEERYNLWDRAVLYYRWIWLVEKFKIAKSKKKEIILKNGVNKISYKITPKKRGILVLNSGNILISDFFSLFNRVKKYDKQNQILVYPKRQYINPEIFNFKKNTRASNKQANKKDNYGYDFFSLREYSLGDNKRDIYYKSLAKFDYPLVKEYSKSENNEIFLFLDSFSKDKDLFEKSISLFYSFINPINDKTKISYSSIDNHIFNINISKEKNELMKLIVNINPSNKDNFHLLIEHVKKLKNNMGNLIFIFSYFDQKRQDFINKLIINNIEAKVIVTVED